MNQWVKEPQNKVLQKQLLCVGRIQSRLWNWTTDLHAHTHTQSSIYAHLHKHIAIMLRLKYDISTNKFWLSSQRDLCWDNLGCIVSVYSVPRPHLNAEAVDIRQTSESIVGAALIPHPPGNDASMHVLTFKNEDVAPKIHGRWGVRICPCLHVYCMYLGEHEPALTLLTSCVFSCHFEHSLVVSLEDQSSYHAGLDLDETWQVAFEDSVDLMRGRKKGVFILF